MDWRSGASHASGRPGGATLILFGTVAVAGIKILAQSHLDRRASTIAALSLSLGLGVTFVPNILDGLPSLLRDTLSSGIATGGISSLLLNAVIPVSEIPE